MLWKCSFTLIFVNAIMDIWIFCPFFLNSLYDQFNRLERESKLLLLSLTVWSRAKISNRVVVMIIVHCLFKLHYQYNTHTHRAKHTPTHTYAHMPKTHTHTKKHTAHQKHTHTQQHIHHICTHSFTCIVQLNMIQNIWQKYF